MGLLILWVHGRRLIAIVVVELHLRYFDPEHGGPLLFPEVASLFAASLTLRIRRTKLIIIILLAAPCQLNTSRRQPLLIPQRSTGQVAVVEGVLLLVVGEVDEGFGFRLLALDDDVAQL